MDFDTGTRNKEQIDRRKEERTWFILNEVDKITCVIMGKIKDSIYK